MIRRKSAKECYLLIFFPAALDRKQFLSELPVRISVVPPEESIRPKTHVNEGDARASSSVEDGLESAAGKLEKAEVIGAELQAASKPVFLRATFAAVAR